MNSSGAQVWFGLEDIWAHQHTCHRVGATRISNNHDARFLAGVHHEFSVRAHQQAKLLWVDALGVGPQAHVGSEIFQLFAQI
jgi:hypothetical protein